MSEAKITKANLMGDQHVYYITLESSFWGDKRLIVYDMDGDGIITDSDGNTAQGDIIDGIGVNSDDFKAKAQELITEFQKKLPEEIKKFRACWDGSFYENSFNDCVVDENGDNLPDRLGFTTSKDDIEVSISYSKQDLPPKCDLKDEYEGMFKNPKDELLRISTKDGSRDRFFSCEPREPRGVAQYFKEFNAEPEGYYAHCSMVEPTYDEQKELAMLKSLNWACNKVEGLGSEVSSAASATASFFSSAGEYISEWWNSDDDEYVYHDDSHQPTMISHLKL